MKTAEQYVADMSGAPPAPGMAPYPLYGLPHLGTEGEEGVPFYKRPMFCYLAGGIAGIGIGYAIFGWFLPRFQKGAPRKNPTRRKVEANATVEE